MFSLILSFIKFIDYKNINQRKTNHRFNFGGIDILPSLQLLLTQVKGQEEGCKGARDGAGAGMGNHMMETGTREALLFLFS